MKSYWVKLDYDENEKEFFLASDVRKEIAILNQKHKEDVNDWLAKFEAVTETNNKEIELRKRWLLYWCDMAGFPMTPKAINEAFTKPISEIEEEMKE